MIKLIDKKIRLQEIQIINRNSNIELSCCFENLIPGNSSLVFCLEFLPQNRWCQKLILFFPKDPNQEYMKILTYRIVASSNACY